MPKPLKPANDDVYWWLSHAETHHINDTFTYYEKLLTALLPAAVDFKESMKRTCTGRASPLPEELLCVRGNVSPMIVDLQSEMHHAVIHPFFLNPYLSEGCPSYGKISVIVSSPICICIVSNYCAKRVSKSDYEAPSIES